jgi:archaellum component FlaD/FlaE
MARSQQVSVGKPYLRSIEEVEDSTAPLRWARYLSETFGAAGALGSLQYYQRMGWIHPRVTGEMTAYLRGLSMDELHNKKYQEPATLERPLESLTGTPFGAHARSLEFIADMAGDDLGEQRILARLARHRSGEDPSGEFDDSPFEPLDGE